MRCSPLPLAPLLAVLLLGCEEADRRVSGPAITETREEPGGIDFQQEAVDSGRAEVLLIERHASRQTSEGTMRIERSVSLPQLVGEEAGIERINGWLRYLALHWPTLPMTGHTSGEEAEEQMREMAGLVELLRPEDWPTPAQMEALEGLFPGDYLEQEFYSAQNEAALWIRIVHFDFRQVVFQFEIFDASGATTRGSEGELALDLRTGKAIHPR